jgi:hypothetical protein
MIYVPDKFQPKHPFPYPEDNHHEFERWYFDNYDMQSEEREYLPIFWTGYYCKHKFGQHKPAMVDMQKFLNGLDRSKKYYTIVQYDHGILNNLRDLDIMVFSMSGGRTDYPLPLVSMPHAAQHEDVHGNFLLNFIGQLTHPIRKIVLRPLMHIHNCFVTTTKQNLYDYTWALQNSTFTLCPRGFGPTSFRIQEALQYGSIPVYISDEFIIPHNIPFEEYGALIEAKDAHRVHEILSAIPESEIRRRQEAIPHIYQKYFSYEGNKEAIKKALKNEKVYN